MFAIGEAALARQPDSPQGAFVYRRYGVVGDRASARCISRVLPTLARVLGIASAFLFAIVAGRISHDEGEVPWVPRRAGHGHGQQPDYGGRVAVIEHLAPKGASSPLHIHTREDEWLDVIDGELAFWVDGEVRSPRFRAPTTVHLWLTQPA